MPLSESLRAQAIRELNDTTCAACGERKQAKRSFCLDCFKKLTHAEQRSLYQTFSEGYAQIYDEIKTKLRAER